MSPAAARAALAAALAAGAALAAPAAADAATVRTSFQLTQLTPSRIWSETSWIPFAQADPPGRVHRYRLGRNTYVGVWVPASASVLTTTEGLGRLLRDLRWNSGGGQAVLADRALTRAESRRLIVLAELYRDADILVVAAGHPACAGLTRAQARAIAAGRVTRWSQVVSGAAADRIRVHHHVNGSGAPVPHLGTRWVGSGTRFRVTYAPGAVGSPDAGVGSAASGDTSVAAVTTWSRIRYRSAGICAVPLNGVAPSEATVGSLRYPEAFPVRYVVTRRVPGRSAADRGAATVQRRAMRAFLRSAKLRGMLEQRGLRPRPTPVVPAPADPAPAEPAAGG